MAREVAQDLAGKGILVQVNTEVSPTVASRLGVRGVPAFFALKKGTVQASVAGALPKERLVRWFLDAVKQT